jgi:hypothetical protein
MSILTALVFTTSGAAVAEADVPGSDVPGVSSKKTDSWFNIDALDLNVYGLSYHPDREAVHEKNLDNQVNWGLALHYSLTDSERGSTFLEAGSYYDSGRNWAKFAGVGYQFRIGKNWKIGGAVAAVNSETYNRGTTFVGMIPLITYDLGPIKLNGVYFPKVANYNRVDVFAFYLSIPFSTFLGHDRSPAR